MPCVPNRGEVYTDLTPTYDQRKEVRLYGTLLPTQLQATRSRGLPDPPYYSDRQRRLTRRRPVRRKIYEPASFSYQLACLMHQANRTEWSQIRPTSLWGCTNRPAVGGYPACLTNSSRSKMFARPGPSGYLRHDLRIWTSTADRQPRARNHGWLKTF